MVRIVFYGTPTFAVPALTRLLATPYQVVGVITQPDRPRGRGRQMSHSPVKATATEHGVPLFQPERGMANAVGFIDELQALHADLGVVAAYGRMLSDAALATPRLGTLNLHASLLPKYRGAAPVHRAIIAGEHETGVTIMRLVHEMDAGPMLARCVYPIGPNDLSIEVEAALAEMGANLMIETIERLVADDVTEKEQNHAKATFAPRITHDDGLIDWHASAADIHNLIRGLHPWPHAFGYMNGARYLIHRSTIVAPPPSTAAGPGVVIEATKDRLIVATGHSGALALTEIQSEGRRPLDIRAFLAGHRWTVGTHFTTAPL